MPLTIPNEPITVELDPARWIRGQYSASLLNEFGNGMCCWGFACLALGATEDEIRGKDAVHIAFPGLALGDRVFNDTKQYEINDDQNESTDAARVAALNADAEKHQLPVRFVLKQP